MHDGDLHHRRDQQQIGDPGDELNVKRQEDHADRRRDYVEQRMQTGGSFRRQTTADRRKYAGDGRTDAGTEDKRHRRIQGHRPGFI